MFNSTVLEALSGVGIPGYVDEEEGLLVAHPANVPQDRALYGEHVVVIPQNCDGSGYYAVAWGLDGPGFEEVATVYETPGDDVKQCAQAVAEWFTVPRPTAGGVFLAALAQWGVNGYSDDVGMTYVIPLDPATPATDVCNRPHLSVGDRYPSIDHVPAAHTGWTVFLHDECGAPVGDALFVSGDGGPVNCGADSKAAAEVIADYLTSPSR
ncbi:hypothetical protein ACIQU6_27945 [Streptomyces sp. NPDC090442]|uniref:hypothetical protein n=1 Tax=Streptomyces sp. NPDC090442 TaxID=3365962 RepID=UPI003816AE06